MFQTDTCGVIIMPKNQRVMSQNVLGDVGNWANTLLSWSATSRPRLLFCVRALRFLFRVG